MPDNIWTAAPPRRRKKGANERGDDVVRADALGGTPSWELKHGAIPPKIILRTALIATTL